MQVREAEPDEAGTVAEEFWHPLAREMERHSELNELSGDALAVAREGFADLLDADDRHVFLLEAGGDAVGFLTCELGERPTRRLGRYLSVEDLYVKESFRGRGYGTRLLEEAEALADAEDCGFVRVSAEWGNEAARRFYEARGYGEKQVTFAKSLD